MPLGGETSNDNISMIYVRMLKPDGHRLRDEGIHIREIMSTRVTTFVA